MDLEVPADAWYVWVGVALVSVGLLGVALALPSQPPPDAAKAANAIDRVAGSTHQATASYDHDATAVRIGTKQLSMRNDGGTAHASIAFGSLTPVSAVENSTIRRVLERILHGQSPERAIATESGVDDVAQLRHGAGGAADARDQIERRGAAWRSAAEQLRVRKLELAGETVILIVA
jgi:hypothetical protein